jgi:hypothetical protein
MKTGKPYVYICPICGEPIKEPQTTAHTEDGLAHEKCCVTCSKEAEKIALDLWQQSLKPK